MHTWCLKICEEALVFQLSLNFIKKTWQRIHPLLPHPAYCAEAFETRQAHLWSTTHTKGSFCAFFILQLPRFGFCFVLLFVVLGMWFEWRTSPHKLDVRTLSPQLVASFGDIVESFKVRAIWRKDVIGGGSWGLLVLPHFLCTLFLVLMVEMWLWTSCSCWFARL